jgi:hypothetical protein
VLALAEEPDIEQSLWRQMWDDLTSHVLGGNDGDGGGGGGAP